MKRETTLATVGQPRGQEGTSVGKALGGKLATLSFAAATAVATVPAHAEIAVPESLLGVFTDLGTAFGTLMAAGAILFGVVRGGVALFKLAGRVFSAAGA